MTNNQVTNPITQRNVDTILAWLDAHNCQDMKAIDYYTEDIEVVEMPTGVVYRGMGKMRELARIAYRRKGSKELTHIIATETEACVEYIARADTSEPLTEEEKRSGLHGIDISKAKFSIEPFAIPVCYICHLRRPAKLIACANIGMLGP